MDQELYDKGMKIRREVLGDAYVDRALAKSGEFNDPLQELVTTYCWGWCWGREGLARRYLCINGVWQDHLLFGMLHEDFRH